MPKPICVQCSTNDSLLWRNHEGGQICNECYLANTVSSEAKADVKSEGEGKEEEEGARAAGEPTPARATGKGTRKSTRATRYKPKPSAAGAAPRPAGAPPRPAGAPPRPPAPRGRGRRSLFKRPPLKAPTATATVVSSDSIFYKGSYLQVGDVVRVQDEAGGWYYAQLRGFLSDQYCERSAALTWLLPTRASPPPERGFDPATYIIGPEEELPRRLDCMEFVLHAPADYFHCARAPFPRTERALLDQPGYVWSALEPRDY